MGRLTIIPQQTNNKMPKTPKSNNSETKKDSPRSKASSKGSKTNKNENSENDANSGDEESPQDILAQHLASMMENSNTLREQQKALPGIIKRAGKRTRKAGTTSANNALTRQMGIPPPLIALLRNPEDGKKLNKKSTLSRPKLASAIMNYCKKSGTDVGKGMWKPDDTLREALGIKKKDAISHIAVQKVISALYKEHNIVAVVTESAAADTGKNTKSKRRVSEDDDNSDSESVQSEESEAPKKKRSSKQSNA